jgi:hypothetical protein
MALAAKLAVGRDTEVGDDLDMCGDMFDKWCAS